MGDGNVIARQGAQEHATPRGCRGLRAVEADGEQGRMDGSPRDRHAEPLGQPLPRRHVKRGREPREVRVARMRERVGERERLRPRRMHAVQLPAFDGQPPRADDPQRVASLLERRQRRDDLGDRPRQHRRLEPPWLVLGDDGAGGCHAQLPCGAGVSRVDVVTFGELAGRERVSSGRRRGVRRRRRRRRDRTGTCGVRRGDRLGRAAAASCRGRE